MALGWRHDAGAAETARTMTTNDLFIHLASIASDTQRDMADLFERLGTISAAPHDGPDRLITDILKLIAESLDVGVTYLTRVDETAVCVERVYDRAGMGLRRGDVVALGDSY